MSVRKYNIDWIEYRDVYGNLLFRDRMRFKRLHAIEEEIMWGSHRYVVKRVAVADNVQHVNLRGPDPMRFKFR